MGDADSKTSGENARKYQLVLTLNMEDFTLAIGGKMANYDMGIAMCKMAIRALEGKIRAAELLAASQGTRVYVPD